MENWFASEWIVLWLYLAGFSENIVAFLVRDRMIMDEHGLTDRDLSLTFCVTKYTVGIAYAAFWPIMSIRLFFLKF